MQHITSPTRKTALDNDDESDIDVDEEAAAAIKAGLEFADDENGDADINVETLGMTSERQKEIQGSLFRMLGHENDGKETASPNGTSADDAVKDASSGEDL